MMELVNNACHLNVKNQFALAKTKIPIAMTTLIVVSICIVEIQQSGLFLHLVQFLKVNMTFAKMIMNVRMIKCAGIRMRITK